MSITELFFDAVFAVIDIILSMVPRLYLPESFETAFELLESFVPDVAFFISMSTVANIITLVLAWYFVVLIFAFLNFILRKVPVLNMK